MLASVSIIKCLLYQCVNLPSINVYDTFIWDINCINYVGIFYLLFYMWWDFYLRLSLIVCDNPVMCLRGPCPILNYLLFLNAFLIISLCSILFFPVLSIFVLKLYPFIAILEEKKILYWFLVWVQQNVKSTLFTKFYCFSKQRCLLFILMSDVWTLTLLSFFCLIHVWSFV